MKLFDVFVSLRGALFATKQSYLKIASSRLKASGLAMTLVFLSICVSYIKQGFAADSQYTIFDDNMLLDGYAQKYSTESKEILMEMIKDDTLSAYKSAAAVRIFKERFSREILSPEKGVVEKILIRRLNHTDSTFVQVEIMHTLCLMDRYKYFNSMVPALIQKLDHYNETVNELAYNSLNNTIELGHNRPREARLVFNTLRKNLFLSRKRLSSTKEPGPQLKRKLDLLRWSMKVLGSQELKRLPREVINLL